MSGVSFPVEKSFATGQQGATLVLMVCAGWLWAGLYATPYSITPYQVAATVGHRVRITPSQLLVGAGAFPLTGKSLQAAHRWLDRQGVTVRAVSTTARSRAANPAEAV
ncbi:hypothetical protein ABE522_06120 [Stenotrophomonas pennii]|uniref:hypothetical protein n=1 Tax=Stenotrophomonas lacuserhaii TaxID=2760084 RepID=UPI003209A6D0